MADRLVVTMQPGRDRMTQSLDLAESDFVPAADIDRTERGFSSGRFGPSLAERARVFFEIKASDWLQVAPRRNDVFSLML